MAKSKVQKLIDEDRKKSNGMNSKSRGSVITRSPGTDTADGNWWASVGKNDAKVMSATSLKNRANQIEKTKGKSSSGLYRTGTTEEGTTKAKNKILANKTPNAAKAKKNEGKSVKAKSGGSTAKKLELPKAGQTKKKTAKKSKKNN